MWEGNTYVHDRDDDKIPKGVEHVQANSITRLHVGSLRDNTKLLTVSLPSTLETIGSWAFFGCTSLKSITIPDSVTFIGDSSFHSCTSLQQITIENHQRSFLDKIGFEAFANCTSLVSFEIPISPNVDTIDSWFNGCTSLKNIVIPDTIQEIGFGAFKNCTSLKSLILPSTVTVVESNAFFNCLSLKDIYLPALLRRIGSKAFYRCTSLEVVKFPKKSLLTIGGRAFFGCTSLKSITIPECIIQLGNGVFHSCTSLQQITIQNYEASSMEEIGFEAFANCSSLVSFQIPVSPSIQKIDAWFVDCESLQDVVIPSTITAVGINAFRNCKMLKSLILPSTVVEIGDNAFFDCSAMKAVYLPAEISHIGKNSFCKCSALLLIAFPRELREMEYNTTTFFGLGVLDSPRLRSWRYLLERFDKLPLHRSCYYFHPTKEATQGFLIETTKEHPNEVIATDALGFTALHVLCCNPGITLEMIQQMIAAAPSVVEKKDAYGMTPLMLFMSCHANLFDEDNSIIADRWPLLDLIRRDKETGLYPFMSAACNKNCSLKEVYLLAKQFPGLTIPEK